MNYLYRYCPRCLPLALITGMLLFAQQLSTYAGATLNDSTDVSRIVVGKEQFFFQDGATPTLETDNPYGAIALLLLKDGGSITGTPTMTFDPGGAESPSFNFMNEGEADWFVEGEFADIATLNSTVPSGIYEINYTGDADGSQTDNVVMQVLNSADDFLDAPDFSNYDDLQLITDFSTAFDIEVTIPQEAGNILVLSLYDVQSDSDVDLDAPGGGSIMPERETTTDTVYTFSIPASVLQDGGGYEVCVTLVDVASATAGFNGLDIGVITGLFTETCMEMGDTTYRNLQLQFGFNEGFNFSVPSGNTVTTNIAASPVTPNYGLFYGLEGNPGDFPAQGDVTFDADDNSLDGTADNAFIPDSFGFGNYASIRTSLPGSPSSSFNASVSFSGQGVVASEVFNLATAISHHLIFVPTVNLDGSGNITSIDWTYQDTGGSAVPTPGFINNIFITIIDNGEGYNVLEEEFNLNGSSTTYSPTSTINWSEVGGISFGYNDTDDSQFNQNFGVDVESVTSNPSMTMIFRTDGMMEDSDGPAIGAETFTYPYPEGILSYYLAFNLDVNPIPASINANDVTFTSPVNGHFNGESSDFANITGTGIFAQSQPVSLDGEDSNFNYPDYNTGSDNGDYTASYMGMDYTTSITPELAFLYHYAINPTVNISGGNITTIDWTYLSPYDGTQYNHENFLLNVGLTLTDLVVNINTFSGNDFEQRNLNDDTIDLTAEGIAWDDVESIDIAFVDEEGIVYQSHFDTYNVGGPSSSDIRVQILHDPGQFDDPNGGTVEVGSTVQYTGAPGYRMVFNVSDSNYPFYEDVYFTDANGSGLNSTSAQVSVFQGFRTVYVSPTVEDADPPTGSVNDTYTVNYNGQDYNEVIDTSNFATDDRIMEPSVTLDGDNEIVTVSWTYHERNTGNETSAPAGITSILMIITANETTAYANGAISPGVVNVGVSASNINWDNVNSIVLQYTDAAGNDFRNLYLTQTSLEGQPDLEAPDSLPVFSMFQAQTPVDGGFFGFPVARLDDNHFIVGEEETYLHVYHRDTGYVRSLDTTALGGGALGNGLVYIPGTNQVATGSEDIMVSGMSGAGAVFLLDADGGMFGSQIDNPEPEADDAFGINVALIGTHLLAVGADLDDHNGNYTDAGTVYIYDLDNDLLLDATIRKSTPEDYDQFGIRLAAAGSERLLIGAPQGEGDGSSSVGPGEAYIYDTVGETLTEILQPGSPSTGDLFGNAVAAVGSDTLAVGAPGINNAQGAVYLYDSTNLSHSVTLTSPNPTDGEFFGVSLAAVGDSRILVGATQVPDGDSTPTLAGRAYLFDSGGNHLATFTAPSPTIGDTFGGTLAALDENTIVIGAPLDDTEGTNAGKVYLFDVTPPDADVYIYGVIKNEYNVQTGPSTVIPETGGEFEFSVLVLPQPTGSVSGGTFTPPGGSPIVIPLDPEDNELSYDVTYNDQTSMDAAYPNGSYEFSIDATNDGIQTATLDLDTSPYPTPYPVVKPQLDSNDYDAAQELDPTYPFTLNWNTFTGNTGNDFILVNIEDAFTGDTVFQSALPFIEGALAGSTTSLEIPADTLEVHKMYIGFIAFFKVVELDTASYPGAFGVAAFSSETSFPINTYLSFDRWAETLIPDSNQRGYFDDPDGDGIVNILEYYLIMSPSVVSNLALPAVAEGDGELLVTYRQRINTGGLTPVWEISQTLGSDSWSPATINSVDILSVGTFFQMVTVHIDIPDGADAAFVRLNFQSD